MNLRKRPFLWYNIQMWMRRFGFGVALGFLLFGVGISEAHAERLVYLDPCQAFRADCLGGTSQPAVPSLPAPAPAPSPAPTPRADVPVAHPTILPLPLPPAAVPSFPGERASSHAAASLPSSGVPLTAAGALSLFSATYATYIRCRRKNAVGA